MGLVAGLATLIPALVQGLEILLPGRKQGAQKLAIAQPVIEAVAKADAPADNQTVFLNEVMRGATMIVGGLVIIMNAKRDAP